MTSTVPATLTNGSIDRTGGGTGGRRPPRSTAGRGRSIPWMPAAEGPVGREVTAFVDAVTAELAELAAPRGRDPAPLRSDVVTEAATLVAALIDADGRHTRDELDAYLQAFAGDVPGLRGLAPDALRGTQVVAGRASWLGGVSPLFDLLVQADARRGTHRSHTYYQTALALLLSVAALDLVP